MNFPLVNMLGEEEGRGTQTEGLITKASVYQTPGKLRSVQSLSHVQLFAIPGTAAHQASLSRQLDFTNSKMGIRYSGKIQEQLKPLLTLNVFTP